MRTNGHFCFEFLRIGDPAGPPNDFRYVHNLPSEMLISYYYLIAGSFCQESHSNLGFSRAHSCKGSRRSRKGLASGPST